ncbi:Protein SMY2 [Spathaspora sp. JA1]|nr:Protein SMY2 [Spathaspora sp. JA1]
MYSRPRRNQSLDHSANNGISSFDSQESLPPTIQPNKGGKKYSMNEVFQVWYDNKDQILNPTMELPIKASESYRLSKPNQIYHLDLQPSSIESHVGQTGQQEVNESLEKLSLEDFPAAHSDVTGGTQGIPPPPAAAPPPPGISENVLSRDQPPATTTTAAPLVTSDKIEWYYIDPLGTEQGPFNGDMMQEWLTGGYLTLDLKIRRKEESGFKTLKDLCDSVQNYIQPFKIPLPDLNFVDQRPSPVDPAPTSQFFQPQLSDPNSQLPVQPQQQQPQPQQQQSQFHHHFLPESNLGGPGSVRLPGLSSGPQSTLFGNDWKNDPFASPITTPSATTASFPGHHVHPVHHHFGIETFNHHSPFGSNIPLQHSTMPSLLQPQIQQQQPQQPLSATATSGWGLDNSLLSSSNPATPVNPVLAPQVNHQPTPTSPWVSNNVQSSSRVNSPFAPTSSLGSSSKGPSPLLDNSKDAPEEIVLDEIHNVVTGILEEEVTEQKNVEPEPEPVAEPLPESPEEVEPEQEEDEEEEEISQDSEEEDTSVQLKPAVPQELAPWASKPQEITKPKLTLKQIQQIEAEKLEKQKKIDAQIRSEQAAKAWAALDEQQEQTSVEKVISAFPATWASGNITSTGPSKTLAEIHREEAEAAKAKQTAAAAAAVASSKPSSLPKVSLASTLANSVPKDDGFAWTTVASKKQPALKKSITTTSTITSAAKTNPQLLRAVSASKVSTPSVNVKGIREDFLVWARSNMTNLYPSVTKDDLLDIFITLPSNSPDSVQLISETIYSSSATMDGRRFAQEFMKRRQKVDQSIGYAEAHDQSAWADAVISSADKIQTVDEDGWSTGKTKKRNKKH